MRDILPLKHLIFYRLLASASSAHMIALVRLCGVGSASGQPLEHPSSSVAAVHFPIAVREALAAAVHPLHNKTFRKHDLHTVETGLKQQCCPVFRLLPLSPFLPFSRTSFVEQPKTIHSPF